MKKILSLLTILTVSTPFASIVSGCSTKQNEDKLNNSEVIIQPSKKFDVWNLSTWGAQQKQVINQAYLNEAKNYDSDTTWGDWLYTYLYENSAIDISFDKINPLIDVFNPNPNISRFYLPTPNDKDSLKDVLSKGIELYVKGIKDGIYGDLTMEIKGNI